MPDDIGCFGDDLVRCVYPGSNDIPPAEGQRSVTKRFDQWLQVVRRSRVRRAAVKLVSLAFSTSETNFDTIADCPSQHIFSHPLLHALDIRKALCSVTAGGAQSFK